MPRDVPPKGAKIKLKNLKFSPRGWKDQGKGQKGAEVNMRTNTGGIKVHISIYK